MFPLVALCTQYNFMWSNLSSICDSSSWNVKRGHVENVTCQIDPFYLSARGDYGDYHNNIELKIKANRDTAMSPSYPDRYVSFIPWSHFFKFTMRAVWKQNRRYQFSHCELFVNTQHLHLKYISLSWFDISDLVFPIMISLIECWY